MPETPITEFERNDDLLNVFWRAMNYSSENLEAEWPGNILSKRTVIYADGTIAREGEPVKFAVDPEELALCRRISTEANKMMDGAPVVGGSAFEPWGPFYNTAQAGAIIPERIDADLIRARFNGTIYAGAEIAVEPMAETGDWWKRVAGVFSGEEEEEENGLKRWKAMIQWFKSQPEFIDTAFVRIGDNLEDSLDSPPEDDVEYFGVVMPRLAIGLTRNGSLAGLGGFAVLA